MSGGGQVVPFDRGRLRDDVRSALSDPRRVAELLQLQEGAKPETRGGLLVRCPSHGENNASCSLTRGPDGTLRAKCFACDFSGDVFSLIAAVKGLDPRRDFPRVLEEAAALAGISVPDAPRWTRSSAPAQPRASAAPQAQAPVAEDLGLLWDSLPPIDGDAWEYLRGRGLEEAADWCRSLADVLAPKPLAPQGHERDAAGARTCGGAIKCSTCRWEYASSGYQIAVALRDVWGRVVAVQVRNIHAEKTDAKDNRFLAIGPTSTGVFGDPTAIARARNVIVAEGMTDSLAAIAVCRGASVTTPIGIAGVNAGAALDTLPLKGKRVLLASDPDEAGDLLCDGRTEEQAAAETIRRGKPVKAVKGLAEKLQERGAIPLRARPPVDSDLAKMLHDGVDLVAFFRDVLSRVAGFRAAHERLVGERAERLAITPRILTFGVRWLDVALGGFFPSDVVLLGGASGQGKTELARLIAQANAHLGRRVHYFALEADPREIERRAKYTVLADRILSSVGGSRYWERLNYLDWYAGRIDDLTGPFEAEADQHVAVVLRNLFTRYFDREVFGIADFERAAIQLGDDTDLIILDHFHYLDFGEQENRAAKEAMKRIRSIALTTGKPVLVVAHVRKAERGGKRLIPILDDFHGASDVMKMATKAIILAPASDRQNAQPHLWKTYLSAGKCRIEGSRARYAACVVFDARRRSYEDAFILGTVSPGGDKFTEVEAGRLPGWARAAVRQHQLPDATGTDDAGPPAPDDAPPPAPPPDLADEPAPEPQAAVDDARFPGEWDLEEPAGREPGEDG